ncbi:MAG TPA: phospholipid carrier-dependent glycosyltransferase, partial [Candidatus Paceibacterota bacterium]|nr:phospholipid carrier-dependent glycosyltransferase [Candidatus Paceibacterota bacterium]
MSTFFARTSLRSLSTSWNAKDLFFIGVIALLSLLLRLPSIAEPSRAVFDEAIYANNAIRIVEGVPWIDPHPYFARSLFATIAGEFPFQTTAIEWRTNAPFEDFPYLPLRFLMAFFGTLLPVLLYAIGRGLGLAPPWASVAGVLAAIEPGFVIFSRIMVPDMMLLAFGFAGIALALAGAEATDRRVRIACAVLAGACFGAAIATKWTALGLLATGIFALLLARRFVSAAGVAATALGVYVAAFVWFFSAFPMGGHPEPVVTSLFPKNGMEIMLPGDRSQTLQAIFDLHTAMFLINDSDDYTRTIAPSPHPLTWSLGLAKLPLWLSDDGTRQITLAGNPILWTLALIAFLLALVAAG